MPSCYDSAASMLLSCCSAVATGIFRSVREAPAIRSLGGPARAAGGKLRIPSGCCQCNCCCLQLLLLLRRPAASALALTASPPPSQPKSLFLCGFQNKLLCCSYIPTAVINPGKLSLPNAIRNVTFHLVLKETTQRLRLSKIGLLAVCL